MSFFIIIILSFTYVSVHFFPIKKLLFRKIKKIQVLWGFLPVSALERKKMAQSKEVTEESLIKKLFIKK